MRTWHGGIHPHSWRTVLLVSLCIVLLLFAFTVQAVHTHEDGAFHGNCALCVAAHAALAIIISVALILLLQGVALLFARQEKAISRFLVVFALSIRPPPAASLLS